MRLLFVRILSKEHHLVSPEGKNGYATYQDMYEHNLYSLRYLCTFSHSKNNSKFTGSLLKIYVCDVNKTLPSMKVKYVYVIQNRIHLHLHSTTIHQNSDDYTSALRKQTLKKKKKYIYIYNNNK